MANRVLPNDVSLTFNFVGQVPNISGGFLVGTASQYQVWSDRTVWDVTNNAALKPGVDFSPYLLFGD